MQRFFYHGKALPGFFKGSDIDGTTGLKIQSWAPLFHIHHSLLNPIETIRNVSCDILTVTHDRKSAPTLGARSAQ